jgi:hypothetical protein
VPRTDIALITGSTLGSHDARKSGSDAGLRLRVVLHALLAMRRRGRYNWLYFRFSTNSGSPAHVIATDGLIKSRDAPELPARTRSCLGLGGDPTRLGCDPNPAERDQGVSIAAQIAVAGWAAVHAATLSATSAPALSYGAAIRG